MKSGVVRQAEVAASKRARRAAFGGFVGAMVDWYDFLLYGIVAALVFQSQFFPKVSPAMGTLAALATFGVGFLFRPLGGIVFGHFGDRLGRKRMLILTVTLMGSATALIGLLPTFAMIGWWAPALLVTLRAVQGFAVGGEWGGAALMAVESAPVARKAFYSSGVQVGYGVGLILATGLVSLLSHLLSDDAFHTWGWRLPFLFSVFLVALGLWVRNGTEEAQVFQDAVAREALISAMQTPTTSSFTADGAQTAEVAKPAGVVVHSRSSRFPVIEALRQHPKAFLQIIGLRLSELFTMYIVTAFTLNYSTVHLDLPRSLFLNIGLLVGAVSCVTIPCFAWLADRVGLRRVYIIGALIGCAGAIPFFLALQARSIVWIVIFAVLIANIAHDMVVSVQQPMFTELFGASYRYSGAGVGYQLASVVGGGFTPFIAALMVEMSGGSWHPVAAYLAVGCLISVWVASTMSGAQKQKNPRMLPNK